MCVAGGSAMKPSYTKTSSGTAATSMLFTRRRLPAAKLRALAYGVSTPALSAANAARLMNISPRTASVSGAVSRSGTVRMVRTFSVTSLPVRPLPRVTACSSTPSR